MTAQLPSKVRLAQIASFTKSMALPPSHDEIEAMARALLAAHEQEPVAWQYRVSAGKATGWSLWHNGNGEEYEKSYQVERRPLYARPAPVPAVPDEKDKFSPDVKSPYDAGRVRGCNDCRAAMLNGGKS